MEEKQKSKAVPTPPPDPTGDCFEAAVKYMRDEVTPDKEECFMLVHGICTGRGQIAGIRFVHAWIEIDTGPLGVICLEVANGKRMSMPKEAYYKIGEIEESDTVRYTKASAYTMMLRTMVFGPWDEKFDGMV